MKKTSSFLGILMILGIINLGYAQNVPEQKPTFHYEYSTILLDSTYDAQRNPDLVSYVDKKRAKMDMIMNEVIGHCPEALNDYKPASPLSNFLTDMLLEKAPDYIDDPDFQRCDFSLLNFGGIRAPIEAGDVTIGDIYAVSPFDNYVVFAQLKGSELKKVFKRFTDKDCQPYSGAQITYRNSKPVSMFVNGRPIDDNRIYTMATINFILEGGDDILKDVKFEKTAYTSVILRDFLIQEIKKLTQTGMEIESEMDDRAVIKIDR